MSASWNGFKLRHARRIWPAAYSVGGVLALVLGAGAWSVLIGVATAFAVVLPLEIRTRLRHEPVVRDDRSRYP